MDIKNHKILSTDYTGKDIAGLPDTVSGDAASVKARFDALVKEVVAPKYNALIDELKAYFDVLDMDGDGAVDNALHANYAEESGSALKANGLVSSITHREKSFTPTATSAADADSFTLEPGTYLYIIEVTWSKINTATKLIVRNSYNKVPSKVYGYFPIGNITPGIQSVDIINITSTTTVASQVWPEDSTSLKAYTVHTKIYKLG